MQDKWAGDIGDFAKYGLLRHLCDGFDSQKAQYSCLGVIWYLNKPTSSESKNQETSARTFQYLDDPISFKECDCDLFCALQPLKNPEKRSIAKVQNLEILPQAKFYDVPVPPSQKSNDHKPIDSYGKDRTKWFEGALSVTADADVIFVDPDNGIKADDSSPQDVSIAELRRIKQDGKSIIIYHHFGRHNSEPVQIECMARSLKDILGISGSLWGLRWNRVSTRVFFIVAQKSHESKFRQRIEELKRKPWVTQKHFSITEF